MPTLTLIDGSGFIFRAYHALPPMTDSEGTPVGAVYGFTNMLMKLLKDQQPEYLAVVFDVARKTFRNRIYEEYKAHRPPPPEDLIPQFALVRDAARALNLPILEREDYEADDLIATYTRMARAQGIDVRIVSSDKDLMQLIDEHVKLYDGMKQKTIGEAEVIEKFGVPPAKVREVLALMGDASDNVPGVPGIGPKTAAELIGQYGDLETLLSRTDEIKQPKRREALQTHTRQARLSYELIQLCDRVPEVPPIETLSLKKPDPEALAAFLQKHGFKSLLNRIGNRESGIESIPPANAQSPVPDSQFSIPSSHYELIQTESQLAAWIAEATTVGHVAFDTETTGLNAMQAELVGFSLCRMAGKACYVPVGHTESGIGNRESGKILEQNDLFSSSQFSIPDSRFLLPGQLPLATALTHLKPLLENSAVLKIGHNIKYDMLVLKKYGLEIAPVDDTMLISYVLSAGAHGQGLDELAKLHFGHEMIPYDAVTGTGKERKSFAEVGLEKARDYAAEDADFTLRLWQHLKPQLVGEKLLSVYETFERPLIPVLVRMEERGIKVDAAQLKDLSSYFARLMAVLEEQIFKLADGEFNVASPKQLGEILFEKMQLPGGKKSAKTGAYGTDSGVLEELAEAGHELPRKVIEHRQLAKLKSTYADALVEEINPKTGRVHTSYAMAITSTGRLSSSDPNLQNIPIRTEEGRKIRNAFVAAPGHVLLSADYSQIELRLLAHMADITTLKEAFKNGDDIHAITASRMFGVPVGEVNADLRRSAKTINFGIIYGMSAHGLATRLNIGRAEAAGFIDAYFKNYPGIRDYMESTKDLARAQGYVTTLYGRRCYLPGINDKGPRRAFFERAAINAPLQGTAADIIKRAMIAIDRGIGRVILFPNAQSPMPNAQLLLQVHDELVFEVVQSQAQDAAAFVKTHMESAASLSVPLTVETGFGTHWGEAH